MIRLECKAPHPAGPGRKPHHGQLLLEWRGRGTPTWTGRVLDHAAQARMGHQEDGTFYLALTCPKSDCRKVTEYRLEARP